MSLWSFRFLLWYICILFVQPQNRFTFLWPFHIADIAVVASLGLHFMSALQENRPLIKFGPATICALLLLVLGLLSQYVGAYQTSVRWNSHIDLLAKSVLLLVMVEAMAFSVERVWAVSATMLLSTLWWIKGGLRLSAAGASYSGDRIMGPAVSIIENPNGFAYMMCVMIPLYLYFYQQSDKRYMRGLFLATALSAVYIVFETGSRTGILILIALGCFLLPKYGRQHKRTIIIAAASIFLLISIVSPGNLERIKSVPRSIASALSGEDKDMRQMNQDEQSAKERGLKNEHTWALIRENILFGVGMKPDESLFADRFPYATGQVHCEILMAGKQMGFLGMALYISFISIMFGAGWRTERRLVETAPGVADLGWTYKMQAVTIVVGGAFSPLPWNVVTLVLAGLASSLWGQAQLVEASNTLQGQTLGEVST